MEDFIDARIGENDLQLLLLKIRSKYFSLTDAAKRIADYLLERHDEAVYLNISELAKKCEVSESTITKFIKTIGFNGFHELKICLARNASSSYRDDIVYEELSLEDDIESICTKTFNNNIEALKSSLRILDFKSIERAALAILKAKKVDFYGMGSSTVAILNAKMRLYRLGIQCFTYNDPHQQIMSASLLRKGDVAVGITNSGKSIDIVNALELARQSEAITICITNHDDTPITKCADIRLFTSTKDSEVLSESLHARVAEIALLDSLYACIASKMKNQALKNLYKTSEAIKIYKHNL